jgi:hypothetical protein
MIITTNINITLKMYRLHSKDFFSLPINLFYLFSLDPEMGKRLFSRK